MVELTIASMNPAHLLQVYDIEKQVNPKPWEISQFEESIDQHHSVVANLGTIVVGFLVYSVILDESEILTIAVNPDYQRQGVAKYLFNDYLKTLPTNVINIYLEVRRSNKPAIRFYQSLGFEQTGCRKNYYQTATGALEDAFLMCMSRR